MIENFVQTQLLKLSAFKLNKTKFFKSKPHQKWHKYVSQGRYWNLLKLTKKFEWNFSRTLKFHFLLWNQVMPKLFREVLLLLCHVIAYKSLISPNFGSPFLLMHQNGVILYYVR